MTRKATCCCGDCSIVVAGEPVLNAVCHCSSCKRRTGSAFGWSTYFPDDKVREKNGVTSVYAREGEFGYRRHFCARCGTTLYWKSFALLPDHTGIAGGCFADNALPPPTMATFEESRCSWLGF